MTFRRIFSTTILVIYASLTAMFFIVVPLTVQAQDGTVDSACKITGKVIDEATGEKDVDRAIRMQISIPGVTQSVTVASPDGKSTETFNGVKNMACYMAGFYRYFAGIAGIIATIMMMYGGFVYVTAFGNAQKASQAKDIITSALIGLAITLSSYVILYTINPNLTSLKLPGINSVGTIYQTSDCGVNAKYHPDVQGCVLDCGPDAVVSNSCYDCFDAFDHNQAWSNDFCTTNPNIGKVVKIEPGAADAFQLAIGYTFYGIAKGGEIYFIGGTGGSFKLLLAKFAGVEIVDSIVGTKALIDNPQYQGSKVALNQHGVCCRSTKANQCRYIGPFTDYWTGACSGINYCHDQTPCGNKGPADCIGMYAPNSICYFTWKSDDSLQDADRFQWRGRVPTESLPNYDVNFTHVATNAQVSSLKGVGGFSPDQRSSLPISELAVVPLTNGDCGIVQKDSNGRATGIGKACRGANQQCVITFNGSGTRSFWSGDEGANSLDVFWMGPGRNYRYSGLYVDAMWVWGLGWDEDPANSKIDFSGGQRDFGGEWIVPGYHCLNLTPGT